MGLYFSLMDWHHPDGLRCAKDAAARKRFVAYVHQQVHELVSHYGKIDIFCYDCPKPLATAAQWQSPQLNAAIRRLHPGILINDRSLRPEDYATPEQKIEPAAGRAWEANMTLNDSWGYHRADDNWKSARTVCHNLLRCARLGGNYLLNIGPKADGSIPQPCVRILTEAGRWLAANGKAIYGTDPCDIRGTPFSICTQKANTLFVNCYYWPGERWSMAGLKCRVKSARILSTGQPIGFEQVRYRLQFFGCPAKAPDPITSVVAVECDRPPVQFSWQELYESMERRA